MTGEVRHSGGLGWSSVVEYMSGMCEGLGSPHDHKHYRKNKDCVSKQPPLLLVLNTQERIQSLAEGGREQCDAVAQSPLVPQHQGRDLILSLGTSIVIIYLGDGE